MIPLTFLYDEYIDRPKLSERKKHIRVYSSSPTSEVGSNTETLFTLNLNLTTHFSFNNLKTKFQFKNGRFVHLTASVELYTKIAL